MSHFYFSNGWGLNVTQSFANVTHSDSGGETVFLKVSRATTKSAVLSHTSSHTRVTEFQPFLTFEKVSDSISPSHGYIQTIKNIQIKYRVMGLVSMTACIWCLAFIVVNPKSSSVTSKRHQRVCRSTDVHICRPGNKAWQEADAIGLQVPDSSKQSGEELGKNQQAVGFLQCTELQDMAGTLSNPKTSSRYSTGKKKDNKDKKGSLMVYSCGKIHCVLHILIMFSLNLLLQTLHH